MRLFVPLVFLLVTSTVHAFSAGGHRIIAEIAWQRMDQAERVYYSRLIYHHPRLEDLKKNMPDSVRKASRADQSHWLFLECSVWPNTVRGLPADLRRTWNRPKWHYVNIPIYLRAGDRDHIDLRNVNRKTYVPNVFRDDPDMNVVQAAHANLNGLRGKNRTKAERAVHLCWVLHLFADAHQPLHSSAVFTPKLFPNGDRGGNSIKVNRGRNLHSVWDELLPNERTLGRIGTVARQIQLNAKPLGEQMGTRTPDIHVSNDLAEEYAYTREVRAAIIAAEGSGESEVMVKLSEEYMRTAGRVAKSQACVAGIKLAAML